MRVRWQRLFFSVAAYWGLSVGLYASGGHWLGRIPLTRQIAILGSATLWTLPIAFALQLAAESLAWLLTRKGPNRFSQLATYVPAIPSATFLAAALFTYSYGVLYAFGTDLRVTPSSARFLTWPLIFLVGARIAFRLSRPVVGPPSGFQKKFVTFSFAAVIVCWMADLTAVRFTEPHPAGITRLPNILILTVDGLDANRMSVYGYQKPTTPFLESFAQRADVYYDHYSSGTSSQGTLTSLWTGKDVLRTGVVMQLARLNREHAEESLPNVLRRIGYATHQIGVPGWADSFTAGLKNAFDSVNFRGPTLPDGSFFPWRYLTRVVSHSTYQFVDELLQSQVVSLRHTLPSKKPSIDNLQTDRQKLAQVGELIKGQTRPWFVHLHLMETHGHFLDSRPHFFPRNDAFTRHLTKAEHHETEFYEGAILDADRNLGRFFKRYGSSLEETIVVITSDHNFGHVNDTPIPLLIRWPDSDRQRIFRNKVTSTTDLAPTLLDYLGQPVPTWMSGSSLRRYSALPLERPVLLVDGITLRCGEHGKCDWHSTAKFPHGISSFSLLYCDRRLRGNLTPDGKISSINYVRTHHPSDPSAKCAAAIGDIEPQLFARIYAEASDAQNHVP